MITAIDIPTDLWNQALDLLLENGWHKKYVYDNMDVGIDYNEFILFKEETQVVLTWDNWFEGEISCPESVLNWLEQELKADFKRGEPSNLKRKSMAPQEIGLQTPLSIRSSFGFPLQSPIARREVLIGGLLLLVPVIGWLLNMGHRIQMVHNMMQGRYAWPAWRDYPNLLRHGLITFVGMLYYYIPAMICGLLSWQTGLTGWAIAGLVCFVLATTVIPGYMSHYCIAFDWKQIFNPIKAVKHVLDCGKMYWYAWLIALSALALSFIGLIGLGIGFLFSSVWFWQVAGFSFATTMSHRHRLLQKDQK